MHKCLRLVVILSLLLVVFGLGSEPTTQLSVDWNLAFDNEVSRVNWPYLERQEIWHINRPGIMTLAIRGNFKGEIAFDSVQLRRKANHIKTIRISLPSGTIEETYQAAMKLADDWGFVDRESLEEFYKTHGRRIEHGETPYYYIQLDAEQGRAIEIRQTFNKDKPYCALLTLGFSDDFRITPSTQPTMKLK